MNQVETQLNGDRKYIPLPEEGTEAEQLQELSDWVWKAFVESIDPREIYRREFLSIEVKRFSR